MTVLLITTAEVKSRMVMAPEMLGVDPALTSAIEGAQVRVETELDTSLQASVNSDLFYIEPEYFGGVIPQGNLWRLMLTNGLLRDDVPVVVTVQRSLIAPPLPLVPTKIDLEKGIIYLDATLTTRQYVRVEYSAGFNEEDDVPTWLSEAILGFVPAVLKLGPSVDKSTAVAYKDSEDHAANMMARKYRNVGLTFRPIC